MLQRPRLAAGCLLLVLGLSGCPVTDDYFIDVAQGGGGADASGGTSMGADAAGGTGALAQGGTEPAGTGGTEANGGSAPQGGSLPVGGQTDVALAGEAGVAGAPPVCVPNTERCNGHDDDCNDIIDEQACNSKANGTFGCSGFVVPSRADHGYMLCPTETKTYDDAQQSCIAQGMRLVWFETEAENAEVSTKVQALTNAVDVYIGANDKDKEGAWHWDGPRGFPFWQGDQNGAVVDGAFAAWLVGTPNDSGDGEDCGVLTPAMAAWGDRGCSTKYGYLCEDREPE